MAVNTGMVEIIKADIVGLTRCKPKVSPIKYRKGSKKASKANIFKSPTRMAYFLKNNIATNHINVDEISKRINNMVKGSKYLSTIELNTNDIPQNNMAKNINTYTQATFVSSFTYYIIFVRNRLEFLPKFVFPILRFDWYRYCFLTTFRLFLSKQKGEHFAGLTTFCFVLFLFSPT